MTNDLPDFTPDPAFTTPAPEPFTPAEPADTDDKPAKATKPYGGKYQPYKW